MLAAHEHARCAAAVHCRTARAPRMMCAEPAEVQLTCLISAAGSLAVFCSVAALKLAFPLKRVQLSKVACCPSQRAACKVPVNVHASVDVVL